MTEKLTARLERLEYQMAKHSHNAVHNFVILPPDPTPPSDGDHGADDLPTREEADEWEALHHAARPIDNRIGPNFGKELPAPEPSPAPDEAAKWKEVADVFDDHPEIVFGDDRDAVIEARIQAAHAAVAKAIELGLAASADRAVVVTDAMVGDVKALLSAARETINQSDDGWLGREYDPNPLATAVERVGEHVADIEAALRAAERGEDDRG